MIPYILQVTINLSVSLAFYKIFLQKETFYRLNRWVLMTCLAVAFVLPLLTVPAGWSLFPGRWQTISFVNPRAQSSLNAHTPSSPDPQSASSVNRQSASSVNRQNPSSVNVQVPPRVTLQATPPVDPRSSSSVDQRSPASGDWHTPPSSTAELQPHPSGNLIVSPAAHTPAATASTPPRPSISLLDWITYIYIFGVIIAAISLMFQVTILLIQAYARPVVKDGSFRIIEMTGDHAPCSFGNNIFINPTRYDRETYQQILLHEKIHASGWHTLDILLAEICIVIHWFNPFAWRYRREVENNLEFLTDQAVLRDPGIERESYQLSLLKVAAPNMPLSITSNYNQSLLKQRIIMMNAQHSSIHTVWKYFFLLPLLVFLVCALNHTAAIAQTAGSPKKNAKPVTKTTDTLTDTISGISVQVNPDIKLSPNVQVNPTLQVNPNLQVVTPDQQVTTNLQLSQNLQVTPNVQLAPLNMNLDINVSTGNHLQGDTSRPGTRADRTQGSWFATSKDDKLSIEFRGESEEHNWSNNSYIPRSEFTGLTSTGKVEFRLVREAGTITFTGQFDGDQGFGHYTFQPNAEYAASLRKMEITADENDMVTFFFLNIKKDYIAMLQANGYPHISKNHIISMAALHIDEPFIRSWKDLGYTELSEERLISAKAMRLDRAYVEDLRKAGYDHLPMENLISFKALGINGDYVRRLNPASPLPAQDLITYKSLKIDSAYVASLKRAGYSDIPAHDLVTLKSMHIDGEFIQSFRDIGYTDIPVHDLVTLKSMHVTPEYIKGFRDIGYQDIPVGTLVSLKSLGITPAYIKDFNSLGFKNIPLNQLHSLKAMGVTADYVNKMREKGFVSDNLEKYIRLKTAF